MLPVGAHPPQLPPVQVPQLSSLQGRCPRATSSGNPRFWVLTPRCGRKADTAARIWGRAHQRGQPPPAPPAPSTSPAQVTSRPAPPGQRGTPVGEQHLPQLRLTQPAQVQGLGWLQCPGAAPQLRHQQHREPPAAPSPGPLGSTSTAPHRQTPGPARPPKDTPPHGQHSPLTGSPPRPPKCLPRPFPPRPAQQSPTTPTSMASASPLTRPAWPSAAWSWLGCSTGSQLSSPPAAGGP